MLCLCCWPLNPLPAGSDDAFTCGVTNLATTASSFLFDDGRTFFSEDGALPPNARFRTVSDTPELSVWGVEPITGKADARRGVGCLDGPSIVDEFFDVDDAAVEVA